MHWDSSDETSEIAPPNTEPGGAFSFVPTLDIEVNSYQPQENTIFAKDFDMNKLFCTRIFFIS